MSRGRLNEERSDFENTNVKQFSVMGDGVFSTAPAVVDRLEPGVYDIQKTYNGQLVWTKHEIMCDELIEIHGAQSDRLFEDMVSFWASKEKYDRLGFVHKRAYLLHGPQGTGKTATSNMLAKRVVGMGGIVFIPPSPGVLAEILQEFRKLQPDVPVMAMLEELTYFIAIDQMTMLNLLDGNESVSGVVMVATTNNVEQLHDNIKNRPGRFDRVVLVDPPSLEVRLQYVERVLARDETMSVESRRFLTKAIAEATGVASISLAHTREVVIAHVILGTPLDEVIKRMSSEKIEDPENMDDD